MGDTTQIKKGAVIRHNNDLFVVKDFQFVNPGKGAAFTKTKMKSISSGKGIEMTYKSGESVDVVQVQRQNMQYLYQSGDMYSFMNQATYETVDVSHDILGDDVKYLKEGLEVMAIMHEGNVVAIDLPKKIEYTVKTAPPAVKGDTASGNVTKEVICDNGLIVYAPIFIKEGEVILVNTETGDYGGRSGE
ncbi:MAG: elongation factor P [Candidatus Magasanikbacteria bacterium CG10_big_fil_rev_8_21_14_0_10_47_10]|uniref:Elongation factor P n=1 Tax=Candidatus Magasanikbacteria bacterium CG10_big_fil_rev_8_21_14_0_10_47_10 TaxID=1974652 RepID=A0A2H0TQU7_9BACT|nr:MAG: elongation factor P [Candidatus Magasanikbacteria bacterium CG10_big_fil_rev_8_21_14_0_10_47_10]